MVKMASLSALLVAALAVAPAVSAQPSQPPSQPPAQTVPGSPPDSPPAVTGLTPPAPPAVTPPTGQAQGASGERRICRTITRTGSRLARERVCRTQAEWDQVTRTARQTTERLQRNDGSSDPNGQ